MKRTRNRYAFCLQPRHQLRPASSVAHPPQTSRPFGPGNQACTPCCQVPSYTVHRADDGVKKRLVVEVSLPGIASGADLIVSVREADKSLYIRAPGRYKLTVPLGVPVEGVAEGVKFVRKKAVLKVGAVVLH